MNSIEQKWVKDTLIGQIARLCKEADDKLETLSKHRFKHEENQKHFETWLEHLACTCRQLMVHKDLEKTDLTDIDIAKEVQSYFVDKKYKKRVAFLVRDSHGGESKQVTEPEELSRYFTISYCLPIMQLVPMQLALNARKYMPTDSLLQVELTTTEKRNYIVFSNVGPQCGDEEIREITDEGTRGQNTAGYAGMGIGLSEVQTILDIHHAWLETTLDVDSTSKYTIINGFRHSIFNAEITYLNKPDFTAIQPTIEDLRDRIPMFLIHNSMDIANSLLDICDHLLKINEKTGKEWREHVYSLRLSASILFKTVKECIFMTNGQNSDDILGLECRHFNLRNAFIAIAKELCKYRYPGITLDMMGSLKPKYTNLATWDGMRTFLLAVCELFMDNVLDDAMVEVNFDDEQISLKSDHEAVKRKFSDIQELDTYRSASFHMCDELISALGGNIDMGSNYITIYLP